MKGQFARTALLLHLVSYERVHSWLRLLIGNHHLNEYNRGNDIEAMQDRLISREPNTVASISACAMAASWHGWRILRGIGWLLPENL